MCYNYVATIDATDMDIITFTLEEVKGADEVIVTSSGVPCTAAERVDGIKVGGRSERLLARLKDMLYGGFELACALDRGEYGK